MRTTNQIMAHIERINKSRVLYERLYNVVIKHINDNRNLSICQTIVAYTLKLFFHFNGKLAYIHWNMLFSELKDHCIEKGGQA